MMLPKNEGKVDRIIRIVLGIILAVAGYYYMSGVAQIVVYIVAAIFIFTAISGFCALYKLFGISTKK